MRWKFFVYVDEASQRATNVSGISVWRKEKRHFCLAILGKTAQPTDGH